MLDWADRFGGGQRCASWLVRAMKSLGHDVACASLAGPVQGRSYPEFFEVKDWFTPRGLFPPKGKLYQLLLGLGSATLDCDREFQPEVIINTAPFPPALRDIKAKKVQYIYYPFDLSLLKKDNPLFRLYRAPIWHFNREALDRIDMFIAISNYSRQATIDAWGKYLHGKDISVIYSAAIDVEDFRMQIPRENKVCYVGRIHPLKGVDDVIQGFERAKVPGSRLVIAGGVDNQAISQAYYSRLLEKEAKSQGKIEVMPNPSDQRVIEVYASSRAFANFFFGEHFGIVPVEAMAAGTPPVVARGGGQLETVVDGKTGFLVSNVEEMGDRMSCLLTDDALFRRMSEDARRHVEAKFSREAFVRSWNEAMEKLMA